jgi:hypothetical protein
MTGIRLTATADLQDTGDVHYLFQVRNMFFSRTQVLEPPFLEPPFGESATLLRANKAALALLEGSFDLIYKDDLMPSSPNDNSLVGRLNP